MSESYSLYSAEGMWTFANDKSVGCIPADQLGLKDSNLITLWVGL